MNHAICNFLNDVFVFSLLYLYVSVLIFVLVDSTTDAFLSLLPDSLEERKKEAFILLPVSIILFFLLAAAVSTESKIELIYSLIFCYDIYNIFFIIIDVLCVLSFLLQMYNTNLFANSVQIQHFDLDVYNFFMHYKNNL